MPNIEVKTTKSKNYNYIEHHIKNVRIYIEKPNETASRKEPRVIISQDQITSDGSHLERVYLQGQDAVNFMNIMKEISQLDFLD